MIGADKDLARTYCMDCGKHGLAYGHPARPECRFKDLHEKAGGRPLRVYVASSWRNPLQPGVVAALRDAGHDVYDFRAPTPDVLGFSWKHCEGDPPPWSAEKTREVLAHPRAEQGFGFDLAAMRWADAIVMLQPSGRSAALELGWGAGAGKKTCVLLADHQEPELMLKVADRLCTTFPEVLAFLAEVSR